MKIAAASLATSLLVHMAFASTQRTEPYIWKSVQMVGGGFMDGIVFHPKAKDLRYCRTDIGGAYRWDQRNKEWTPLLNWLGWEDINLMGVESIGLDPSDPNRLYLACGTYTNATTPNGAILRSDDRGKTFARADMPFKMGGNENGRGNGERLAVDPNDGRILYFGSRKAGLWRSVDRAVTWRQVTAFPTPITPESAGPYGYRNQAVGIVCVLFDPRSGSPGNGSATIYAAVSVSGQSNLYRSTDRGESWQAIPDEPIRLCPTRMVLASDGMLYMTAGSSAGPSIMRDGAVWKLDTATGVWTDITPEKPDPENGKAFGYAAVSVDHHDSKVLIVSSFYRPGGEEIYRSQDGGATWTPLMHRAAYDFSLAPYVAKTPIHWLFDIEIDPFNSNHALFTTGYGGYETLNLEAADHGQPTHWSVMSKGIEETVVLQMATPKSGAPLISATGDYAGFAQWNLDKPSPEGNYEHPRFGDTTGVACAQNSPNVVVRVGSPSGGAAGGTIGYSVDGGKTWQPTATLPAPRASRGRIAVSADGQTWIWSLPSSGSYYTRDHGSTWTPCEGLPANLETISDPVNPSKFYALSLFDGKIFGSLDGGASFTAIPFDLPGGLPKPGGDRGDSRGGQDHLYATPGKEGDLWIAAHEGLYHSVDSGVVWRQSPDVQIVHAFGFGKPAPKAEFPALYLSGAIAGMDAIYRSDDAGQSWVRINDDQHRFALILQISGDPRIYGRVYVGTHGRGIYYGDPARR